MKRIEIVVQLTAAMLSASKFHFPEERKSAIRYAENMADEILRLDALQPIKPVPTPEPHAVHKKGWGAP